MATIDNRPLKAFVRFDGTGRIVPSSLILRRKKPKVGKWVEIPAYECCNPIPGREVYTYPSQYPINNIALAIYCNEVQVSYDYTNKDANNLTELVYILNHDPIYSQYGVYSNGGDGRVKLTMPESKALELCPSGTIDMNITAD